MPELQRARSITTRESCDEMVEGIETGIETNLRHGGGSIRQQKDRMIQPDFQQIFIRTERCEMLEQAAEMKRTHKRACRDVCKCDIVVQIVYDELLASIDSLKVKVFGLRCNRLELRERLIGQPRKDPLQNLYTKHVQAERIRMPTAGHGTVDQCQEIIRLGY